MQEILVTFTLAVAAVSLGILAGVMIAEFLILRPGRERREQRRDEQVQKILDKLYPVTQTPQEIEDDKAIGRNIDLWA
tara:strand:- start:32 stop:265 length:234 start_codon:yes stop_codon:yes gene_type:complete